MLQTSLRVKLLDMTYSSKSNHTSSSTDNPPVFWYSPVTLYLLCDLLNLVRIWIRTLRLGCRCTGTRLRTRSDVEPLTRSILPTCVPPRSFAVDIRFIASIGQSSLPGYPQSCLDLSMPLSR